MREDITCCQHILMREHVLCFGAARWFIFSGAVTQDSGLLIHKGLFSSQPKPSWLADTQRPRTRQGEGLSQAEGGMAKDSRPQLSNITSNVISKSLAEPLSP
jgi:hypothetical protein